MRRKTVVSINYMTLAMQTSHEMGLELAQKQHMSWSMFPLVWQRGASPLDHVVTEISPEVAQPKLQYEQTP